MLLWDVTPFNTTGDEVEKVLENMRVTVNKNMIPGDTSPLKPGGIRIGLPALTTRGFLEKDMW